MSTELPQPALHGTKEPISEEVYEQPQTPSETRALSDDLQSGEFSVENIERIYRYAQYSPSMVNIKLIFLVNWIGASSLHSG